MKILKKVTGVVLALGMVVGSVFVGNKDDSYAATSYKKQLVEGVTYKCDLDGDKDLDSIKIYVSGRKLLLKVNNTIKTIDSDYIEYYDYTARIYDFNKNDKSLDIVVTVHEDDWANTRILKFKNNTCKLNRLYRDATVSSYNPNNGMVSLLECFGGKYEKFTNSIGCFLCYDKVRINGFNAYDQYTANTDIWIRKNKYKVAKTLTAYTSTSSKKKAFTVSKGSRVYVYSLYQKGSTRYVKVKNSAGKYGYIKAGSSLLFTQDSCLWFR